MIPGIAAPNRKALMRRVTGAKRTQRLRRAVTANAAGKSTNASTMPLPPTDGPSPVVAASINQNAGTETASGARIPNTNFDAFDNGGLAVTERLKESFVRPCSGWFPFTSATDGHAARPAVGAWLDG